MNNSDVISALSSIEDEFISGLKKIISVKSVKGKKEVTAPFGVGPKKALVDTLEIANNLGFDTHMINHAVGYAQIGNDNENYIGVIGHLDVVPAGTGWHYPPYDLTLDNGTFYGRGVLDNKGPILANLYALAALKRICFPFNKTIRIIFGTDEESGSQDIPMYLEKEAPPMYGYTPDCKYPAVYGERGIVAVTITSQISDGSLNQITHISGNFQRSSVPDEVTISLFNGLSFDIIGKRAPSNAPDLGINAITLLATKVDKHLTGNIASYFTWLKHLHDDHEGKCLGIDFSDESSGKLALTPVNLELNEESIRLSLSIRYPISVTEKDILNRLNDHLPKESTVSVTRSMPSVVFDKNHPMIHTMTSVYESVTQLDGTPVTTTGATYARSMPNIVAFGPSFPGQKGIAHNKDEYMTKKDLMMNLRIYGLLLAELSQ